MKKVLTVTLVLVFACALIFALGCNKKAEETGMEGGQTMEQSTETPPAGGMMDSTGAATAAPDTAKTGM
ncbi:MAG TPA: hypothetical protein VI643_05985 [Planctomycetota bacterium]|nr:hypothetical protein [Planctomycetota bacterium]